MMWSEPMLPVQLWIRSRRTLTRSFGLFMEGSWTEHTFLIATPILTLHFSSDPGGVEAEV